MLNPHQTYRTASIQTADRGKLVVMVYDHCIQWCDRALEASSNIEARTKALTRVQDGLAELTCALDMENGGEIAKQLWQLYDFMTWKLHESLIQKMDEGINVVRTMLSELRGAWQVAAETVRKTQPSVVAGQAHSFALRG
ncbi:MAG: flagellar export chaperone FliS [Fibrobacteria bacterium]|nr:flagellar export chaperone FliS [Fibrobacteria bacterium]